MFARVSTIALQGVLSLFVALLVAEMVERWVASVPSAASISRGRYRLASNENLGYEPIANMKSADHKAAFMDYKESSNRLGMRDVDHPLEKGQQFRILVLGDSVTSGHYIDSFEDTFPWLLQEKLRSRGKSVEVLNFGVNGYNTQQEIELLKDRGLAFSPDLVIVAYCLNDRVRSDGGLLRSLLVIGKNKGLILPDLGRVLNRSHLLRLALYRYKMKTAITGHYQALFEDRVQPYFSEFSALAQKHKFRTLVAVFPDFRDLGKAAPKGEYPAIEALATEASLPVLQLLPIVQACSDRGVRRLNRDLYHPDVAGHDCIAEGLAQEIQSMIP